MNTCLPCNKHYFYVILDSSIALPHSLSLSRTHTQLLAGISALGMARCMQTLNVRFTKRISYMDVSMCMSYY